MSEREMMLYRLKRVVEVLAQVTEEDFYGGHPNPRHVPGVVYNPRTHSVAIGHNTGWVGDYIVREDGKIGIISKRALERYWEPIV